MEANLGPMTVMPAILDLIISQAALLLQNTRKLDAIIDLQHPVTLEQQQRFKEDLQRIRDRLQHQGNILNNFCALQASRDSKNANDSISCAENLLKTVEKWHQFNLTILTPHEMQLPAEDATVDPTKHQPTVRSMLNPNFLPSLTQDLRSMLMTLKLLKLQRLSQSGEQVSSVAETSPRRPAYYLQFLQERISLAARSIDAIEKEILTLEAQQKTPKTNQLQLKHRAVRSSNASRLALGNKIIRLTDQKNKLTNKLEKGVQLKNHAECLRFLTIINLTLLQDPHYLAYAAYLYIQIYSVLSSNPQTNISLGIAREILKTHKAKETYVKHNRMLAKALAIIQEHHATMPTSLHARPEADPSMPANGSKTAKSQKKAKHNRQTHPNAPQVSEDALGQCRLGLRKTNNMTFKYQSAHRQKIHNAPQHDNHSTTSPTKDHEKPTGSSLATQAAEVCRNGIMATAAKLHKEEEVQRKNEISK